jgi:hypothetical protein
MFSRDLRAATAEAALYYGSAGILPQALPVVPLRPHKKSVEKSKAEMPH